MVSNPSKHPRLLVVLLQKRWAFGAAKRSPYQNPQGFPAGCFFRRIWAAPWRVPRALQQHVVGTVVVGLKKKTTTNKEQNLEITGVIILPTQRMHDYKGNSPK